MPIKINNKAVNKIIINDKEVLKVVLNGATKYQKNTSPYFSYTDIVTTYGKNSSTMGTTPSNVNGMQLNLVRQALQNTGIANNYRSSVMDLNRSISGNVNMPYDSNNLDTAQYIIHQIKLYNTTTTARSNCVVEIKDGNGNIVYQATGVNIPNNTNIAVTIPIMDDIKFSTDDGYVLSIYRSQWGTTYYQVTVCLDSVDIYPSLL